MKWNPIILSLVLCVSCSISQKPSSKLQKEKTPKQIKVAKLKAAIQQLKVSQYRIKLGQTKFITKSIPTRLKVSEIRCDAVGPLNFIQEQGLLKFFIPVPYKIEVPHFDCHIKVNGFKKLRKFTSIKVETVKYPTKMLNVSKRHVELSDKNVQRWLKEKKRQEEIYGSPHKVIQFNSPFLKPLNSKITSQFGYKRVFNNKKDSWHSGTDFRAAIGTKIPATNRGIVRFAGELFFNGGTVILDHGMGIFTMYCHLSKVLVSENEIVPQGQIIALSGNTGRSTGPHLHWGVKVNGHWVNSISILSETKKLFTPQK